MSAIHEITEDWQREGLSPTWLKLQQAKAEHDALVAKCEELAKVVASKAELLRGCYAADHRQKQRIAELESRLSAAPAVQPEGDAADAVDETNAVLASRYFELLKVVEAYEKHGVTCQTFRHFIDVPCAECNSAAPAAQPDKVLVDLDVLEAAADSLGSFCSDHGWSDGDMQNLDNLLAFIARHKAKHGIKEQP